MTRFAVFVLARSARPRFQVLLIILDGLRLDYVTKNPEMLAFKNDPSFTRDSQSGELTGVGEGKGAEEGLHLTMTWKLEVRRRLYTNAIPTNSR